MILCDLYLVFEIHFTELFEAAWHIQRINEAAMGLKKQAETFSGCLSYTCFTNIVTMKASVSILCLLNFDIVAIQ